jgi:carotenoid cleavage dioxygenase-like enzyme
MAHIFDIPAYLDGKRATSKTQFPRNDVFAGFNSPSRFEGEVFDLEVHGEIPTAIDGTFYRVQPDHRFPPMYENDIHFNGGKPRLYMPNARREYFRVQNL